MRNLQFWILTAGSVLVCMLYLGQIYLSRAIQQQQQLVAASQQMISSGPTYESSWKQLAARIYQVSRQDPALADVLKRNQISVQVNRPDAAEAPVPKTSPSPMTPRTPNGP